MQNRPISGEVAGSSPVPAFEFSTAPGAEPGGPHSPQERRELRSPFPGSMAGLESRKTQPDKPSLASLLISSFCLPTHSKISNQTNQNNSV